MASHDNLEEERLRAGLGEVVVGREIVVLDQVASTNDCIWQMAQQGSPEGVVVFAEHQTAGRGQRSNTWESAAGKGLWFSVLLHPEIEIEDSARLTTWAAKTVAQTIEQETALQPTIKLPNDILIGGRKVAGVLVEMRAREKLRHLAILGIGLNVHHTSEDFSPNLRDRATSLALLGESSIDRNLFGAALLRNLDRTYRRDFGAGHASPMEPANR